MGKVFLFKKISAFLLAASFVFIFAALYAFSAKPVLCDFGSVTLYEYYGSFSGGENYSGGLVIKRRIKGESCDISGVSYQEILESFSATHVLTEETPFGVSFYAFSPKIPYRAEINGKTVNLHYFKRADEETGAAKLGTPIIFGGY